MKAPYTFKEWQDKEYEGNWEGDIVPELLYDGYVFSLEQLGYEVYGDCYNGITVESITAGLTLYRIPQTTIAAKNPIIASPNSCDGQSFFVHH